MRTKKIIERQILKMDGSIFQYVALAFIAITGLFVVFNLLKGLIRGFRRSITTLVSIIVSAIISLVIALSICSPTSSVMVMVIDAIKNSGGESLQDIFGISELSEAMAHYISMIATPFAFTLLFIPISFVISIILGIVARFIPFFKKRKGAAERLGGMGLGAFCGLIVAFIMLMPIVGVVDMVASAGEELSASKDDNNIVVSTGSYLSLSDVDAVGSQNGDGILNGEIMSFIKGASDNVVIRVYRVGCGWMFNSLASTNFDGERVYLKDDISAILTIVQNIDGLTGDMTNLGEEQVDSFNGLIDGLDKSPLLKHTLSGFISNVAGKWTAGETFMGIEKISAGEMIDPMLDSMIKVLSSTNKETVSGDLRTITKVLSILVEHDMLSDSTDYENMLKKLGEDGVIKELILTVTDDSSRMGVVADEITKLSIRVLSSTLGMPQDAQDRYDGFMGEVAGILNECHNMPVSERVKHATEELKTSFDNYGVDVSDEVIDLIANGMINDFQDQYEVTVEDAEEFFLLYAATNSNIEMYAGNNESYSTLSSSSGLVANVSDGTVSIDGRVLKHYNYSNYTSSAAYKMAKQGVDLGDGAYLYSAESMKSSLITFADIESHLSSYSQWSDKNDEADKISQLFIAAADMFTGGGMDDMSASALVGKMGELLDKMAATETFHDETVQSILKAILQSDKVKSELGLSLSEVNDFADKLNNAAKSENGSGYSQVTGTVSSAIDMISSINDSNATDEEMKENTKKLMENMTPQNAEMLSSMSTPSMMEKYGATSENADIISSSVSAMFDNMANYKSGTGANVDDEAYKAEADAVNKVLSLAISGKDSGGNTIFGTEEEEGRVGTDAKDFVYTVANSEVVSNTVMETVYGKDGTENNVNPYGVEPSESDEESANQALAEYYAENKGQGDDEALELKLDAIASMLNIEPNYKG